MAISKRVRFEVFKRDLFTCQYCGRRPPDVTLEADHVLPVCQGGPDTHDNLTTSCYDCNRGKAGLPLDVALPSISEMEVLEAIQEMAERRALMLARTEEAVRSRAAETEVIELLWAAWEDAFPTEDGRNYEFQPESVRTFIRKGLSGPDLLEALDSTALRNGGGRGMPRLSPSMRWRYFCGACWKMIRASAEPTVQNICGSGYGI